MGAIVTLELPANSPILTLPWIITFGPLSDEEEWEPVVCGPYEYPHAVALAEQIVADEDLMAVVEPVQAFTRVDEIRDEISAAVRAAAGPVADDSPDRDSMGRDSAARDSMEDPVLGSGIDGVDIGAVDIDGMAPSHPDVDELDGDGVPPDDVPVSRVAGPPPSPEEIRAGIARIAARLAGPR